jgi:molybdate transport system ATP-binding protein
VPRLGLDEGAMVRIRIRARDVIVATSRPSGLSALNILAGRVVEIGADEGAMRDIRIELARGSLLARLTNRSLSELDLAPGRNVFAIVKSIALDQASMRADAPTIAANELDL